MLCNVYSNPLINSKSFNLCSHFYFVLSLEFVLRISTAPSVPPVDSRFMKISFYFTLPVFSKLACSRFFSKYEFQDAKTAFCSHVFSVNNSASLTALHLKWLTVNSDACHQEDNGGIFEPYLLIILGLSD